MDVRALDFRFLIFETQKVFLGKPPSHRKMRAWMNVRDFDLRFLIFETQKEFLSKPPYPTVPSTVEWYILDLVDYAGQIYVSLASFNIS